MIKYVKLWFVYLSIVLAVNTCNAQPKYPLTLTQDGESNYEIYISPDADSTLKSAATNFQKYISKISGVELPITNERQTDNQIVVGDSSYIRALAPDIPFDKVKKDGFIIRTEGSNLLISGIHSNGTINGLYHFLEKYLGCRYYSKDAVKIPKKKKIAIDAINDLENPAFQLRILHSYEAFSPVYSKWHKLDIPPRKNPMWANPWIHTTTKYINPNRYFKRHPEYFMLSKGKRIPIEIDFANNKVFDLISNKVRKKLAKNPEIEYIGISQADITRKTSRLVAEKNIPSAVIINFANKVANAFPEKTITTLAYQYSRTPPLSVKPQENVMILIANTTQNTTQAVENKKFLKDLKNWQGLTNNIMVWDYIANQAYPLSPFPNLYYIQRKLKAYKQLGVIKLFAQGIGHKEAEFQELRSYLVSKLLWDVNADVDAIINDFLSGYYGDAAPYIKKYIDEMSAHLNASNSQLIRSYGPARNIKSFLSLSSLNQYEAYFEKAKEAVAENKKLLIRVDKAQLPLRFARIYIYKKMLNEVNTDKVNLKITIKEYNSLLKNFVKRAKKYNVKKIGRGVKSANSFFRLNKIEE